MSWVAKLTFESVKQNGRTVSRVKCICDDCGREEVVQAASGKGLDGQAGQALVRIKRQGWALVGNSLRCLSCEAKRKAAAVAAKSQKSTAKAEAKPVANSVKKSAVESDAVREPTRAQKREIVDLLGEVYDSDQERYKRGDTDETVADVLGVMPGWVAQVRDDMFGPCGGNEEIEALKLDLDARLAVLDEEFQRIHLGIADISERYEKDVKKVLQEMAQHAVRFDDLKAMRARLGKIEAAVGPRKMAGV